MKTKQSANFRLYPETKHMLVLLAQRLGMSQVGVLEFLIRDKARREGVAPKE